MPSSSTAIDGEAPAETFYLIPSADVRDWKTLRRVAKACARNVTAIGK